MSEVSETDELEDIPPQNLEECFKTLSTEARQLYISRTVPVLDAPPSALQFYRDYVCWNRPVLIRNGLKHWQAMHLWQENSYFRDHFQDKSVTVAVTPNGYADSPVNDRKICNARRKKYEFRRFSGCY